MLLFVSLCRGITILLFFQGFFLSRRDVKGVSKQKNLSLEYYLQPTEDSVAAFDYDTVFLFIIDGLRLDFMKYHENSLCDQSKPYNCLSVLHEYLQHKPAQSQFYGLKVDPPTVTAPRLKALTTGSPPTFLSALYNLNSSRLREDNLIQQLATAERYHRTVIGDNTWQSIFPEEFNDYYVFDSFNTRDLDTVDNGILRQLHVIGWNEQTSSRPRKMKRFIVCHFLGVDHIGHTFHAFHSLMSERLQTMNKVIESLINNKALGKLFLLVMGDHGMTNEGEHGGSSFEETMSGLFLYSSIPVFTSNDGKPSYLNERNNQLDFLDPLLILTHPRTIAQIDIVPLLSTVLNIPIPFTSLGVIPPELLLSNPSHSTFTSSMSSNAHQVWRCLNSYFDKDYDISILYQQNDRKISIETRIKRLRTEISQINEKIGKEKDMMFINLWKIYSEAVLDHINLLEQEINDNNLQDRDKRLLVGYRYYEFLQLAQRDVRTRWTEYNHFYLISSLILGIMLVFINRKMFSVYLTSWNQSLEWFSLGLFLFHAFSAGSNSFVLQERQIIFYFMQSMLLLLLYYYLKKRNGVPLKSSSVLVILLLLINRLLFDPIWLNSLMIKISSISVIFILIVISSLHMSSMLPSLSGSVMTINSVFVYMSLQFAEFYWFYQNKSITLGRVLFVLNLLCLIYCFRMSHNQENCRKQDFSLLLYLHTVLMVGIFLPLNQYILLITALTVHWRLMYYFITLFKQHPLFTGIYFLFWERFLYFLTNHGMTFDSLQLSSAFILSNDFNFYIGGVSLFVNTFGSLFILITAVKCFEAISLTDGCLPPRKLLSIIISLRFLALVINFLTLYFLRHHLMLWDVFAPKTVFEIAIFVVMELCELKISPELEASIELGTKDDSNSSTVTVDISLDYLGRFKDQTLQSEYIIYCLEQTPIFSSLVLTALIAGWTIAETIASMWFNGSKSAYEYPFGIASFISIGIGLSLCYAIYLCSCSRPLKNSQCHSRLQVLFICSMNWIFVFKLIQQNVLGTAECIPASLIFSPQLSGTMILAQNSSTTSYNSSEIQLCPDSDSFLSLVSFEMMLVMSFCPQLLMAILYEPRIYILFICYAAVGGLMLYSLYTSIFSILPVLIALIIIAVLLYELHMQRIQSFLTNRRLQAMLHEAERNADAVHAMEMRHMISNVAHDLKTPLASFANGMDLINNILVSAEQSVESNGITPEFFQDCVASIHSCLLNIHNTNAFMLMTINRCIDYTKASKGMKLVPKYETVNLKEALEFPMQCMSNIQDRIGIDLRQLPKGLCDYIITDKQWLQENLLCLLSNAVKYSTEGVVTITTFLTSSKPESYETKDIPRVESHNRLFREPSKLTLDSFKSKGSNSSGTYLQFEIEDTGIGLSADIMKDLFNPFKQAQRLAGGTGLGLYSLAKRTEALQGSYGVKARKDGKQGSLFWFAIPYRPDEAANISSIMRTNSVIPLMRDISCKHSNPSNSFHSSSCSLNFEILIVDDSPSIVKMLSMMLRRLGYGITTAENGEIALKKIEEKWKKDQKGFDLVLMDLQMPVMDGLEATRRLRKLELEGRDWMVLPSKPTLLSPRSSRKQRLRQIIFGVSANSDHDTVKEAMDAGIDDFIGKPFSVEAFNNTLHKYFPKILNFLGGGI